MKLSKLFTTALIPILFLATTFYNKPFEVNAEDIEYTYLEIEDDTLFGFPENFDVQTFLDSQPGPLNNYVEENEGHMVSAATAIDFYSQLSGIDPRILLTLIEVKSRTISDPSATNGQIKTCLGNQDVQTIGFFAQLRWGVDTLLDSYDQAMETDIPKKITFF